MHLGGLEERCKLHSGVWTKGHAAKINFCTI